MYHKTACKRIFFLGVFASMCQIPWQWPWGPKGQTGTWPWEWLVEDKQGQGQKILNKKVLAIDCLSNVYSDLFHVFHLCFSKILLLIHQWHICTGILQGDKVFWLCWGSEDFHRALWSWKDGSKSGGHGIQGQLDWESHVRSYSHHIKCFTEDIQQVCFSVKTCESICLDKPSTQFS